MSFSCHESNNIRRVAIIVNTFSVLQVSQLSRLSTRVSTVTGVNNLFVSQLFLSELVEPLDML